MTQPSCPKNLGELIADLDEDAALTCVRERAAAGESALSIIEDCQAGMRYVGEHYQSGNYFISGLIMAGEIFREAVDILTPLLAGAPQTGTKGTVLLCTVQGDIHDLGKSIVEILLRSHGYTVHDLGVDVPPAEVAREAAALRPDIVGLSGLLTVAVSGMERTVTALREVERELGRPLPIIIGGGMVDENVLRVTGADLWADEAGDGVRLIREKLGAI
jgi:methanogenic corrinoid protein MtbC1